MIKHSSKSRLDWNGLHFFQYNLGQFNLKLESLQGVCDPTPTETSFLQIVTGANLK